MGVNQLKWKGTIPMVKEIGSELKIDKWGLSQVAKRTT